MQQARADGAAALDDVVVLGPTEEAFTELVELAIEIGRPELLRGCRLIDTGSLTDYTLLIYKAEVRMHEGSASSPVLRPGRSLVWRWRVRGLLGVLISLKPTIGPAGAKPTPAQLADGETEARSHSA